MSLFKTMVQSQILRQIAAYPFINRQAAVTVAAKTQFTVPFCYAVSYYFPLKIVFL